MYQRKRQVSKGVLREIRSSGHEEEESRALLISNKIIQLNFEGNIG
jgi:hypothetical protein